MDQFPVWNPSPELEKMIAEWPESLISQILAVGNGPLTSEPDMRMSYFPEMTAASELPGTLALCNSELGSDEMNTQQSPEIGTVSALEDGAAIPPLPGVSDNPNSHETGTGSQAPEQTPTTPASTAEGTPSKKRKRSSVPRQDSPNAIHPLNFTTFREDQDWSWDNMPDILYQLRPDEKRDRKAEADLMTYPIHGKVLRNLPVLPDNIASTVEEFRVEAWMRMDRRVRLKDITDRMHPNFRVKDNALQQRNVRFRQIFGLLAWDSGNKRSREIEKDLLQKMRDKGIDPASNSTRGITPGLINPALGEAGGRIPLPKSGSQAKQGVNKWTKKQKTGSSPLAISHFAEADNLGKAIPTLSLQPVIPDMQAPAPCPNVPQARLEPRDFLQPSVSFGMGGQRRDETQALSVSSMNIKPRPSPINPIPHMCYKGCQRWRIPTPGSAVPVLKLNLSEALAYDLRSPSFVLYGNIARSPLPDTVFPEHCRSTMFRSMVEQCFNQQRYTFELPYFPDVVEGDDKTET
ncbi:hypothetical protein ATEIFO6365_0004013000 [Aspergillus terreus]|uniref:Uncharacterized protein n=1 Tax=Aspergillus terreus TaxID=33178 RepID=A0A5M3ZF62_ASPTE|nr:hypothetical protein ATETN484_0018000400 [Aspergillus terreus]GFF15011.1 hypothetical protein ATEIFO6365_0004013000 [Aspergillus terreus]